MAGTCTRGGGKEGGEGQGGCLFVALSRRVSLLKGKERGGGGCEGGVLLVAMFHGVSC